MHRHRQRQKRFVVPRQPAELPYVRACARTILKRWGMRGTSDDAILIVDELVSQVIRRGAGDTVTVDLVHDGDRVEILVGDQEPRPPEPLSAWCGSESDRGLQIIDAISLDWGVDYGPHGRTVWAELSFA